MIFHRTIDRGERWSAVLVALVVAVVVAAGFSWRDIALAQTAPQKLTISMSSTGMPSIQLFIAREKGFFREEGFDPQLIRMSANAAIAAGVAGELHALGSVGSAVRGIMRGVPLRIISVDLRRPIFWLVSRGEFRTAKELKGKVLGIATINGSQHSAARKMLAIHGVDSDKEMTFSQVGDEATQLQALISNSIQVAGLTPPYVFLARDKFKMNVLESSIDKFPSIQQGIGVQVKTFQDQPDWLRRLLRVKAKSARFFHENEKETAEILARVWKSDLATALEWYRRCKPAFTTTGIPTDDEVKEFLVEEAQVLKLAETVTPARVFDFTLQRAVNKELGIKG
ncbi:MAG TPA: ABC transporter substrate-binding protein [Candidatus Limnocylindria bacterium]|nr:ABC transporter substrate-binding protein [Candidatus Limnocylindria bacterium]